ncbi:MAG: CHAT domain-containing protein, partial [Myxococcota bacterium]
AFAAALEASERLSLAVPFSLQPGASVRRRKPLREEALSALIDAGQRERAFQLDDRVRSGPSRRLRSERGLSVASSTVSEALRARLGALLAQGCLPPAQEAWCRERSLELLARIDDVVRGDRGAERVSSDWTIAELAQRLRPREELWVYTGTSAPSRRFVLGRKGLAPESAPMTEGLAHVYVVSDAQSVPRALLERHLDPGTTLSVLPYASWLLRPRAPRKAEETTVVVADPSGDLPFARREGDEVAALRGGARWIGRGLGAMALMNALRGVDVFHFAGHGTLLSSDPWTTLLRIGGTQVLTLEDWVGRSPQLRLAILDGCSTGGYRPGPGDLGFPQALLETGTRTVLATTRQVRDVVAYRFMEDFRKAGGHLHPGRGFRSAVAASRARKDRGWRAFQLWGDP